MRWFTPPAAREALEDIRPVAEGICRLVRRMDGLRPVKVATDQPVDPHYFSLVRRLVGAFGWLRAHGVQIQDPRIGLIDFPARREGRRVLLCWKVGEPTLAFWHELDAGHAGRRPVDDDGPWEAAPED